MASIMKRGNTYSVRYNYKDHAGKPCKGWETFKTKAEAQERKITVEKELLDGTFLVPDAMTVEEMLYKWIPIQSSKHKWAPKTYQSNLALIQNLIIPYIGEMQMQKLRPYHIEALYDTLSKTPLRAVCGRQAARPLAQAAEAHPLRHHPSRSPPTAAQFVPAGGGVGHPHQKPGPGGSAQKDYPRAQHLGGGGDAGSAGQHGGPHPASGGAPDAGGRAAGRGGGRSDLGGHRL